MKHRYLPAVGGLLLTALSLWAGPAAAQGLRLDPTFQPPQILTASGVQGLVRAVVRQPDGKYLIGGAFGRINGTRVRNLARLHADGTLDATFGAAAEATVAAWPNPATDVLHLHFAPGSQPQTVALLDNLGRVVRQQPVGPAAPTLDLAVRGLPAGAYVLHVDDAQAGPLTQRVLLTC